LLTITTSVHDAQGNATQPDPQFTSCLSGGNSYCTALAAAVRQVPGNVRNKLVSAALFTTMSTTDWVEKARTFVNLPTTPVATPPLFTPSQFPLSQLTGITWIPQDGTPSPTPQPIPLSALSGVDS